VSGNQEKLTLDAIHRLSRYFRRPIDLGHLSSSLEFGWHRLDSGPPFGSFEFENKYFNAVGTVNRGGFAQSLKLKYLYKSHCKSCELL
jgi:hypothetical protein